MTNNPSSTVEAEDTLCEAAHLVTCIMMACADLEEEGQRSPLDTVAMLARDKIRQAIAQLEEARGRPDCRRYHNGDDKEAQP